jgi:hypothetical protein
MYEVRSESWRREITLALSLNQTPVLGISKTGATIRIEYCMQHLAEGKKESTAASG